MEATRIVRHQAYELTCSAKAVDGGKFAPTLVLCKQVWPRRPRVIDVPRGDYLFYCGPHRSLNMHGVLTVR